MNHQQHQLSLSSLSCERNDNVLFQNLNSDIPSGKLLLVQGANGSGKSSLLRILVGLLPPTQGYVTWNGQIIQKIYSHYVSHLIYIGHQNGLRLALTVRENFQPWTKNFEELQSFIQLDLHTPIYKLSAGQQRKVALLRLLLQPKPIWILDEPFSAIDEFAQSMIIPMLQTHLSNNGLIIMSSHQDIALESKYKLYLNLNE